MKDALTFEVGDKGHSQVLLRALLLEVGGKGAEGHRDVLLHLDLLDGPSGAEGAEVKVLARHGAGHQVAEAGVADSLVRVLLQLLGRHQRQAEPVLGHQQLPGEVVQLQGQLEDGLRQLERVARPVAVPVVQAACERGAGGTLGWKETGSASSPALKFARGFLAFPFGLSSSFIPAFLVLLS